MIGASYENDQFGEIADLRAEIERLTALLRECRSLFHGQSLAVQRKPGRNHPQGAGGLQMSAADIEREGMLSDMETLRAEKADLRAEIERLKAAVHVIYKRSASTTHSWESAQDAFKDINQEARKALEGHHRWLNPHLP